MELRNRNLSLQMQGEDIALLQRELKQLGFTIAEDETLGRVFGQSTRQAVVLIQRRGGLEPTGVVDNRTAQRINAGLQPQSYLVTGLVRRTDASAVTHTIIRAFDKELRGEELLGEAVTTETGSYEITYTDAQFARADKKQPISLSEPSRQTIRYLPFLIFISTRKKGKLSTSMSNQAGTPTLRIRNTPRRTRPCLKWCSVGRTGRRRHRLSGGRKMRHPMNKSKANRWEQRQIFLRV